MHSIRKRLRKENKMSKKDFLKNIPSELKGNLSELDRSLSRLNESFDPLLSTPQSDLQAKLYPIEQAKVDLVAVYAINSLFWAYLNTRGLNPKGKGVKTELDRVRAYMNRIKEIEDKKKAPKVNSQAAMRFVRNSLWDAAHKKSQQGKSQGRPVPDDNDEANKEPEDVDDEDAPSTSKMPKMTDVPDDNDKANKEPEDVDDEDAPSTSKMPKMTDGKKRKKKNKPFKSKNKSRHRFLKNASRDLL